MRGKRIILKCDGFVASHMRLSFQTDGLKVDYGVPDTVVRNGLPRIDFAIQQSEKLLFKDNPELRCLFDGNGWSSGDLAAFAQMVEQ